MGRRNAEIRLDVLVRDLETARAIREAGVVPLRLGEGVRKIIYVFDR